MSIDGDVWRDVALACEYATFFHTPIWEEVVVDTYPSLRTATFSAELESGARAVYPLVEVGRRLSGVTRSYTSTFGGCYGGPIADGPLSSADNARVHDRLPHRYAMQVHVTGNPLNSAWKPPGKLRAGADVTHILALNADHAAVARAYGASHRREIARGRAEGIVVEPTQIPHDWKRYYRLYRAALERWGERATSNYPWRLFERLLQAGEENPGTVRLWKAEKDGDLIAGALIFYWNDHAVYWHGAGDSDHSRLAPAKSVLAGAIEHACGAGYRSFDFNPSGGHEGTAWFKSRFGADAHTIGRFHLERGPLLVARRVKDLRSRRLA